MEKELKIKISIDKNTGAVKVIGGEFDALNNKVSKTEKSANSLEKTFLKYASIGAIIYEIKQGFDALYSGAKKFIDIGDEMSLVGSRLSLVTESTQEYSKAQKELLSISNNARVAIRGTTDLYTQLTRSTKELSLSQEYLLGITDTVAKSITLSGASATASEAGLLQFNQGMAAGVLRGEELNSILEQTPRLAQAIADGMGVGIGELRALGAEGKLETQTVLNALKTQSEVINQEFSKIAVNASSGYQVLNNIIDTTVAKIDGQYKVTQAVGQVFLAVGETVETVFTQLSEGWDKSTDASVEFATITTDVIVGFIKGVGYTYDVLEQIADVFSVIRYAGEAAFWGIEVVSQTVAYAISAAMEGTFNFIIGGINGIISHINSITAFVGGPQFSYLDQVNYTDNAKANLSEATGKFSEAWNNLQTSSGDLLQGTEGQVWADYIANTFKLEMKKLIKNSQEQNTSTSTSSPNYDNSVLTDTNSAYQDYLNITNDTTNVNSDLIDTQEKLNSSSSDTISYLDEINNSVETLNTTLGEDGTYSVVTNSSDSISTLNNTLDDLSIATNDAEQFIFQFSDTLLNTFSSSADSLLSVINSSSSFAMEVTYQEALKNMQSLKEQLIANPFDKDIGNAYADAFNTLLDSASNYLDINNFASSQDYNLALATVNTQVSQYQDTAVAGYSVLDSMNDFLESINASFIDGILSDEEKATIAGVAERVNQNNNTLLGTSGAVVGAVNNQEYYNNSGLATDSSLVGSNSVASYIQKLMGSNSSGISLSSISSSINELAVDTGLDVSQLSNLSSIKTNTSSTTSKVGSVYSALGGASSGGVGLDNLQIKSITTGYYWDSDNFGEPTATPSNYNYVKESYQYFGEGGFTGKGLGLRDATGFRQAGIVHEDEWVSPKWMLDQYPFLFAQLEAIRKRGSFAAGGFTSPVSFNSVYAQNANHNTNIENDIRDIRKLGLSQVQQLVNLNKLLKKLSNGGEALVIEGVVA